MYIHFCRLPFLPKYMSDWRTSRRNWPIQRERQIRLARIPRQLETTSTRSNAEGMPYSIVVGCTCIQQMTHRCELFNKAYNHISDRIDQVYKDLTKGKASPMGGVAYLSLEDSEVCFIFREGERWLKSLIRNRTRVVSNTTPCRP
jgi:hypothetical protein